MFSSKVRSWLLLLAIILAFANIWVWLAIKIHNQKQVLPPLPSSPPSSINSENGYQEAWIQFVEKGIVQVQAIDTKVVFIFRPKPNDIGKFITGHIATLNFICDKKIEPNCDPSRPDKLYVNSVPVELLLIRV